MASSVFPPPGSIKSIQSGVINITNTNTSATATITAVNTSKSVLSFLGSGGASSSPTDDSIYISLTNSTTITALRIGSFGGSTVSWQLVEYY